MPSLDIRTARRGGLVVIVLALVVRTVWLAWPSQMGDGQDYLRLGSTLLNTEIYSDDGLIPGSYRRPCTRRFSLASSG